MLTVMTNTEPTPSGATAAAGLVTTGGSLIDEIVHEGARRMLAAALEPEVAAYIAAHAEQLDEHGRRLEVRNGRAEARRVLTSAGAVEVRAPRVNDKRADEVSGERRRFASAILPAWCRKSPKITEVLPLLYLHGLSSRDFVPALEGFLGTDAGLSAATITRLMVQWQDEARAFNDRDLSTVDYVYMWGRHPRQHPFGRGEAVSARAHRRARGRYQGDRRTHRRLPRVGRVLGRPDA
jgi:hypothetical protein